MPETEQEKTPSQRRGFGLDHEASCYRARRPEVPEWGPFFEAIAAHRIVTIEKSWSLAAELSTHLKRLQPDAEKSRAQTSPAKVVGPREADTITFQEGLLNFRATGGGGQMRNANAQRVAIIVPASVMQQQ